MMCEKMLAVISELNGFIAEREESIECTAICLLTKKNGLKLGDTGQAKTFEIDEFCKRITGAKSFVYLMTKQTDEEQLFGRLDLGSLIPGNVAKSVMENDATYMHLLRLLETAKAGCAAALGDMDRWRELEDAAQKMATLRKALAELHSNEPRIITTGKIPEAYIVFLDEIFKSNEGILNALLMVLNERRYTNEGFTVCIPTISFFAASNEKPNFNNPEEQILRPLFDRFDLKVVTDYIKNPDKLRRIMTRKQNGGVNQIQATITLEELCAMQREVAAVAVPEAINELMINICMELRRSGIHVSDRKITNYHPLAQAKAWLSGRDTVAASDLSVLKYYLWSEIEEIQTIQQVLDKLCSTPLQKTLREIVSMADVSYKSIGANAGTKLTVAFNKFKGEMVRLYRMLLDMDAATPDADGKAEIAKAIEELEIISKDAHEEHGINYATLPRLNKLI